MKKNYLLFFILLLTACKTTSYVRILQAFSQKVETDSLLLNQFTGVSVFDMTTLKYIVQHNDRRYFIPASTTKLFTFYTALKILGSSTDTKISALQYAERPDSLVFSGTGSPLLLHPYFQDTVALAFLRRRKEKLYFSDVNWHDTRYGTGWSWDDYNDDYSPEKSPLPLYGNVIQFTSHNQNLRTSPAFTRFNLLKNNDLGEGLTIQRHERENTFEYNLRNAKPADLLEVPFITSSLLTTQLLSDTLHRQVYLTHKLYKKEEYKTLYSLPADTLYRRMLQVSDNFLAEQILTLCSSQLFDNQLNTEKVIDFMLKNHLADLTDKPHWVDGSGLSRMNLFTPRSQVELLLKIHSEMARTPAGQTRLFGLLAAGNRPGTTLSGLYKKYDTFIFGKTGTVSNNVNLSGFLLTKSGKMLCFSFMNNHFLQPVSAVRRKMQDLLTDFYLNY